MRFRIRILAGKRDYIPVTRVDVSEELFQHRNVRSLPVQKPGKIAMSQ